MNFHSNERPEWAHMSVHRMFVIVVLIECSCCQIRIPVSETVKDPTQSGVWKARSRRFLLSAQAPVNKILSNWSAVETAMATIDPGASFTSVFPEISETLRQTHLVGFLQESLANSSWEISSVESYCKPSTVYDTLERVGYSVSDIDFEAWNIDQSQFWEALKAVREGDTSCFVPFFEYVKENAGLLKPALGEKKRTMCTLALGIFEGKRKVVHDKVSTKLFNAQPHLGVLKDALAKISDNLLKNSLVSQCEGPTAPCFRDCILFLLHGSALTLSSWPDLLVCFNLFLLSFCCARWSWQKLTTCAQLEGRKNRMFISTNHH